ncbi:MAG: ureidoglycolate lyase [Pseudomonadota bacterium]
MTGTTPSKAPITLRAQPPSAAITPYGAFIAPPDAPGARARHDRWLAPVAGLAPSFHLNHVAPAKANTPIEQVERHPHSAQVFLPVDVARYLVTVMPAHPDGSPCPENALLFEVPGTLGIAYAPGVWHVGATVLDRAGHFAVLMWRGAQDDDVFTEIPACILSLDTELDRPSARV